MSQPRQRMKQTRSLEERMAEQAAKLKEQASQMPAGAERESLLRRARIAEVDMHLSDWGSVPRPAAAEMIQSSLELLVKIQADLTELRQLALELPPATAGIVEMFADQMEAYARLIDQIA
ncbi:hypothetical protein [Bradyrhizobium sp. SBR1B]|uniref:hypothetical protein n=1 Tax=Bradyrhizobium sp. SBR1B TaxID=2663836 RepID=UPI00182279C7|nr:hypothetical protein [Bradyrhizobium sp. SBR1B]MBB4382929.1 hypothetical protein [Bradyrhizobium sp. SBR1B]